MQYCYILHFPFVLCQVLFHKPLLSEKHLTLTIQLDKRDSTLYKMQKMSVFLVEGKRIILYRVNG